MSSSEGLARGRLLITPKLHRRHQTVLQNPPPPPVKMSPNPYHESKLYKCPPIDDVSEYDCESPDRLAASRDRASVKTSKSKRSESTSDCATSPLSPASGASAACVAMANACSHDHDYIAVVDNSWRENIPSSQIPAQIISHRRRDVRSNSPTKTSHGENDDVIESPRSLQRPAAPAPPKLPNSPRDGKLTRITSSKLRRRYMKVENSSITNDVNKTTSRRSKVDSESAKFVFVSNGRTAEPKPTKPRYQRKSTTNKAPEETESLSEHGKPGFSSVSTGSSKPASTVTPAAAIKTETPVSDDCLSPECFDVTKDELTVAWQSMVKDEKRRKGMPVQEESGDEEDSGDRLPRHSTPIQPSDDLPLKFDLNINSPRPSVTPWPKADESPDNLEDTVGNDSAYSSLASSVISPPPTSNGTPAFRSDSRPGSRTRPPSGTRPASGGKRVAPCSLSSSSSSTCVTSSDEDDSECDSMTSPRSLSKDTDSPKDTSCATPGSARRSDSSRASSGKSVHSHRGHRVVTTRKGKKCLRQRENSGGKKVPSKTPVVPAPPRKPHPKRDPLPMRLRALPLSFWQEPNKLNPSPYNVLPPVPPLFKQGSINDITDIRPVTPPKDEMVRPQVPGYEEGQSVIHNNDPELLQRLFEPVEPQNRSTGIRVRRGRPKRTARVMPSPRLKLDDNPCIMESVTEKLFPKLQIDRRNLARPSHSRAPSCASYAAIDSATSKMSLASELETLVSFNSNGNNNSLGDSGAKELGLLGLSGSGRMNFYDDDLSVGTDVPMDVGTSNHSVARQEMIALPQLTQDYSQMLTKVAAAL